MEVVSDMQEQDAVVCFVGSQAGDLGALDQADIGINFQDLDRISKESSSMVLNPQEFEGIDYSLEEGRLFFANLRKSIRYILMHITPQVVPFIIHLVLASPIPLILLNYFVEVIPAVLFSFEEPELNLLLQPPIHQKSSMQVSNIPGAATSSTVQSAMRFVQTFVRVVSTGIVYNTAMIWWAIVEAGLISSVGCELAFYYVLYRSSVPFSKMFFSANTHFQHNSSDLLLSNRVTIGDKAQLEILYSGQSTYFLGLLMCRFANMLICRREKGCFFARPRSNPKIILFTACGIEVCWAIIFAPFFENFKLIRRPSLISLLFPVGSVTLMLTIDTLRKLRALAT